MDIDDVSQDICRVCRSEGTADKPLFHPCICTGSIKYIHQDCLVQWLKFSKKEYCELCNYRFCFISIYSADMPKRLPFKDIINGLLSNFISAVKFFIHYTIATISWLIIAPLTVYQIFKLLFSESFGLSFTFPFNLLNTENATNDEFYGCFIVTCSFCAFTSIIWLREQILREGPDWLNVNQIENNDPINALEDADNNEDNEEETNNENNQDNISFMNNRHTLHNQILADDDGVQEEVMDAFNVNNGENVAIHQDDVNWIPADWERHADDLTWERIFGFDGSLAFIEHVFWLIFLNGLAIFAFVYCPYHVGLSLLSKIGIENLVLYHRFKGFIVTFCGYIIIGIFLVIFHAILFKFEKARRVLGLTYLIIKVALLIVCRIIVIPSICGWLLDISSLPVLDATEADRKNFFLKYPGFNIFVYWSSGIMLWFFIVALISSLKEILRPSFLWFLDAIDNPDLSIIKGMIHSSIFFYIGRCIFTLITFGFIIVLMVWLPVKAIEKKIPGFLPYKMALFSEHQKSDISFECLLMHFLAPLIFDRNHLSKCFNVILKLWCLGMAYVLGLKSFLFGNSLESNENNADRNNNNADENHQSDRTINDIADYIKPKFFYIRVVGLLFLTYLSLFLAGLYLFIVPTMTGRKIISLYMDEYKFNDVDSIACGFHVGMLLSRLLILLFKWIPSGSSVILTKLKEAWYILLKVIVAVIFIFGLIPFLTGLLFYVVIMVPLHVNENQTPIYYSFKNWFSGILIMKIVYGLAIFGDWRIRQVLEEFYHAGLVNINLTRTFKKLVLPAVLTLGLALSIPYVVINGLLPTFDVSYEQRSNFLRVVYIYIFFISYGAYSLYWQVYKFFRLYEHIKNDKYLVGKRLANYDPIKKSLIKNN